MTGPASPDSGGRRPEGNPVGAYSATAAGRRLPAWLIPLLVLLALLLALAIILPLALSGDKDKKSSTTTTTALTTPATGTEQGTGVGDLVGGGGVAPTSASGALAAPGTLGSVLFTESGAALDAGANAVIASAAEQIRRDGDTVVDVTGYTNTNGNATANLQLSLQRANAVLAALHQQLAGKNITFHATAQGQAQPVAPNDTPQGQQLNRRVTITAHK